jgi:predicted Rossmann-fold nucleotide-binding protein
MQVAVCGPRDCTPAEAGAARTVGELLAARGAVVICGGGSGVMAAVAAGARSGGGLVIGVLPGGAQPEPVLGGGEHPQRIPGADREGASPDLSAVVVTGMGEARNAIIVQSADAVIAIGGSWGTLSEVALAMRRGVPVVSLGGWQVRDRYGQPVPGMVTAADPADAVRLALA